MLILPYINEKTSPCARWFAYDKNPRLAGRKKAKKEFLAGHYYHYTLHAR